MRVRSLSTLLLSLTLLGGMAACSDDTPSQPGVQEFVAKDADFSSYTSWQTTTIDPLTGPDPAGRLFGDHMEADTTISRYIYINNAAATRGSNGQYPNGTILVKQMRRSDGTAAEVVAMAKRGGSFNATHNGWEWLRLNPTTGAITMRGDTLAANTCNGCHQAVKANQDYIFTK